MRKRKNAFLRLMILVLALAPGVAARAEYKKITAFDKDALKEADVAKIYFIGRVSIPKATDLMAAIDDLNANYKGLKKIYLYIDSYGGDMDSGYMAYWAVKSSRIAINTVNLGTVMSAATMIFCGASNRSSVAGGRFIMHPASKRYSNTSFQPDQIETAQQDISEYNKWFFEIYKKCTTFSDDELRSILHSESRRRFASIEEAKNRQIINGIAEGIVDAPISYFITDGPMISRPARQ